MRLINSITLQLEEFGDDQTPEYVILSHMWGDEEVSFKDMQGPIVKQSKGLAKIKSCCAQAARDGFKYAWIDTCCIDKSSSAELSEAINSMYDWYKNAQICYAYLEDATLEADGPDLQYLETLKSSRWFTRGWTLQELIAPSIVEFYDLNWNELGTKLSLQEEVSKITGIDIRVLRGDEPWSCNVAQRMSWASMRTTTRPEDMAYCLIGLFNVNMPLLYGEGGPRAFTRLQEEIMRNSEDYTLFAWSAQYPQASWAHRGLLASSPQEFGNPEGHSRRTWQFSELLHSSPADFGSLPGPPTPGQRQTIWEDPPNLTSRGLRIRLPLRRTGTGEDYLACLYCQREMNDEILCITLRKIPGNRWLFGRVLAHDVVFLPADQMQTFEYSTIYVIQATSDSAEWRPLWSHEYDLQVFGVKLVQDTGQNFSICEVFPKVESEDKWDPVGGKFILHELTHLAVRILEIRGGPKSEPFFIVFGVLKGKNIPWCDVLTGDEMSGYGEGTAEGLYNSTGYWDGYAGKTDRASKLLGLTKLVTAAARQGPLPDVGQQGTRMRGYTLTISVKRQLVFGPHRADSDGF